MSTDVSLARVGNAGLAQFEPQNFEQLERLAGYVAGSKLFGVATVDAAVSVMLTGAALGLAPATALRGIHVVQGKAVLSSDLIAAVILRSGQCESWKVVETSAKRCVIETRRRGAELQRHEWTWQMAELAQLTGKAIWRQFPAAMLRARCTSEVGRLVYPDVLFGVYVEGELDGDATTPPPATITSSATVVEPEPEPAEGPSSRAYAAFIEALVAASTVSEIVALYRPLADALRAEGHDPAAFMEDSDGVKGAFGNTADAMLGLHHLSKAEIRHLLTQPDGPDLAAILDAMARRVVPTEGLDLVQTAALWWRTLGGNATLAARVSRELVWSALARRLAGGVDPAKTKAAKAALAAAVKSLTEGESQASELPAGGEDALQKWRAHIAAKPERDAERGAGAVAGSWLKHRAELEADGVLAEAYAATLDELTRRGVAEPSAFIDGVRHHVEEAR